MQVQCSGQAHKIQNLDKPATSLFVAGEPQGSVSANGIRYSADSGLFRAFRHGPLARGVNQPSSGEGRRRMRVLPNYNFGTGLVALMGSRYSLPIGKSCPRQCLSSSDVDCRRCSHGQASETLYEALRNIDSVESLRSRQLVFPAVLLRIGFSPQCLCGYGFPCRWCTTLRPGYVCTLCRWHEDVSPHDESVLPYEEEHDCTYRTFLFPS